MSQSLNRRNFIHLSAAGGALFLGASTILANRSFGGSPVLVSPGCRTSKVKIAKIYLGKPKALWPTPKLDLDAEIAKYESEFTRMRDSFADVDFVVSQLVDSVDDVKEITPKVQDADGILLIHLSMGISAELQALMDLKKPTVLFAAPYSGHEWVGFGEWERKAPVTCMLTSDKSRLAAAVRPLRAIHHLREGRLLNITSRAMPADYLAAIKEKFGTDMIQITRERAVQAYESIPDDAARAEAKKLIAEADKVVEPNEDEIYRSCKLALAFEKMMDEENATVITADCYGTMYRNLPAFPCIGFTRLNDKGLAGICESDLASAMTFMILQGLSGKPGFISDPTMDMSTDAAILAHCLGSTKMDGPGGARAPYRIRTIMERQEGAVMQVFMRKGEKVTQAILTQPDRLLYFTGEIIDTPDTDRGCRTKITVKVDGDAEKLWKNWSHGLHRVTCYGNIREDLKRFAHLKNIQLIDEA
ncbi:MAG: hypothetical protein ACE15F_00590 [bacterium]